jgi:hypothetical protein
MTPEQQAVKNAKQRERYANDPEYRETMLAMQRERDKTPEGRAKKLARKKRWQAANREKYLEQTRRQNAKRRLDPKYRADAVRRVREWQKAHPGRTLSYRYSRYGLTNGDFEHMLQSQRGLCAICHQPETSTWNGRVRKLAVDHDHATGAVRALLCQRCNLTLGRMQDDPALLRKAADYLEEHA